MIIEYKCRSLDSHRPRNKECHVTELFPSDNYTSLSEKLSSYSKGFRYMSSTSTNMISFNTSFGPVNKRNGQPITVTEVYEVLLPRMAAKWMNIGVLLNIDYEKLEKIEADDKDSEDCLLKMIVQWLKCVDPEPTWNALVKSVEKFNPTLAKDIRDKYCPKKY